MGLVLFQSRISSDEQYLFEFWGLLNGIVRNSLVEYVKIIHNQLPKSTTHILRTLDA